MKKNLWSRNFTLLISATILGAAGGIAGNFALSFLVFDETGSTLAAALVIATQMLPNFFIPLLLSPLMDRLPRKPVLVAGDAANGVLYALAGVYLLNFKFTYIGFLFYSLLISCLSAFDSLAFTAFFPKMIPEGCEEKGYTISGMVYPVMKLVMMPAAAWLFGAIGVAWILIIQGACSVAAALIENNIRVTEQVNREPKKLFSFRQWAEDIKEAVAFLCGHKGLWSIFAYMAVTNGVATGYAPIMIAFFRTAPGFSVAMYSFFSIAEFAGRSLGGLFHYNVSIPPKRRFSMAFLVYQIYELMDMILLWIPYPFMLANRAVCGFLGINSASMREHAVQGTIPENMRARINAFNSMTMSAAYILLSLAVGYLGEFLDYRVCVTLCGAFAAIACWLLIWRNRRDVMKVYNREDKPQPETLRAAED